MLSFIHLLGENLNYLKLSFTNFLDVRGDFLLDLLIASLVVWWLSGVHFVNTHDQLFHAQSECEKCMFTGLTILADAGFEFASTSSHDQYGTVGLANRRKCPYFMVDKLCIM